MDILNTINRLRYRLCEYRKATEGLKAISTHVNAIDIVAALSELGIIDKRAISVEEQNWFRAGLYLSYVFGGSDWEDIVNDFEEIVSYVENQRYFIKSNGT